MDGHDWATVMIAFAAATPATIAAIGSIIIGIVNARKTTAAVANAAVAANKADVAAAKADVAALETIKVGENLAVNTQLTSDMTKSVAETRETVRKVQDQTNGIRERMEARIIELENTNASQREAIGALKMKLSEVKDSKGGG